MKISFDNYNILFGSASALLKEFLSNKTYSSINILVDENTRELCLPLLDAGPLDPTLIEILSGEEHKVLDTCEKIWDVLQGHNVDRHGLMINLGGGVIGDMGGFAASTYMRGIDFIQIPTTLLSQVDASVGGKLGVDFNGYKNFIGLFKNPLTVLIDEEFLKTLPEEELRSGYAEMIKHSLIMDRESWDRFSHARKWQNNINTREIYNSVTIKRNVVEQDPLERGLRKILNFGHTIGHAIETESFRTEKPLLHGHAIGLGMVAEAYLSYRLCGLTRKELEEIFSYILSIYPNRADIARKRQKIAQHVQKDKKNRAGKILFSLLTSIGSCEYNVDVSDDMVLEALDFLADS